MRISDWSSDVCSSDLLGRAQGFLETLRRGAEPRRARPLCRDDEQGEAQGQDLHRLPPPPARQHRDHAIFGARARKRARRGAIEGASCGERVSTYVYISVVALSLTKKNYDLQEVI